MNIFDFEIFLIWIVASAVSLTLFIYLGQLILDFLKIQAPQRTPLKRRVSNTEELKAGKGRRRIVSKPGIICSLPIHSQSRQDAPLF